MINSITIRKLEKQDTNLITKGHELLNRTQGLGLFDLSYVESRLDKSDSCIFVATLGDALIGLGSVQIIHTFEYYSPFDHNLAQDLRYKRVASMNTSSVVESFQGKGVGQMLMRKRLLWAQEQKCDEVLGVSWVSGLRHTSQRVFEKSGFTAVNKVEHFYGQTSSETPFDCPGCHMQPCSCPAILYRLSLTKV